MLGFTAVKVVDDAENGSHNGAIEGAPVVEPRTLILVRDYKHLLLNHYPNPPLAEGR